jgi:hypothetical protein
VIDGMLPQLEPAHNELIRQAAQGDVVYNDDTKVRILELMGKRAARRAAAAPPSTEVRLAGSPCSSAADNMRAKTCTMC